MSCLMACTSASSSVATRTSSSTATVDGVRVLNAGSVGAPYEVEPAAYWLELDPEPRFRRTDYDVEAAAARIRATGYPNLGPLDFLTPRSRAARADERADRGDLRLMLSVCATPIGNLDDVTLRVLEELRSADVVLCEDTRRTRILLDRHGISARLLSYQRHNEAARTAEMLPRLRVGERVALVSDAGLPGVNDPGARLIAAAIERRRAGDGAAGRRRQSRQRSLPAALGSSDTSSSAICRVGPPRLPRWGRSSPPGPMRPSRSSRRSGLSRVSSGWLPRSASVTSPSAGS